MRKKQGLTERCIPVSMSVSEMASLGGKAAAAAMTKKQKSDRARKAAKTRWKGHKKKGT